VNAAVLQVENESCSTACGGHRAPVGGRAGGGSVGKPASKRSPREVNGWSRAAADWRGHVPFHPTDRGRPGWSVGSSLHVSAARSGS